MKVVITAQEALDKGVWKRLCELCGLNPWCISEGRMDSTEEITLTEEQAKELGLMKEDWYVASG